MAHGGGDEVAGEGGGHKKNERKSDGKESEIVCEAGVEEGEKVEEKDGADGKEKRVCQREGYGKLGERGAEKFTDERNILA